ncbi:MAG: ornithine cyclodeaminase family protein [bacterium]|nr:ornithine cyclodeaminase family protein [bacterium]
MKPQGTLLLSRADVASLLGPADYLGLVENAFAAYAKGTTLSLGLLHVDTPDGEFHIKTGGVTDPRIYCGLKMNGGFFSNQSRFGLPNIQGTIALSDGENGYPLAFMDSIEITINRTGATTAVAAKYLARPDSTVATICGCGNQGKVQLRYLKQVLPIDTVYAWDVQDEVAERYAAEMSQNLGINVTAVGDLGPSVQKSHVCVTCTPSKDYFLKRDAVPRGAFVAAVGADSPGKQEVDPQLLASSSLFVDIIEQCAAVGELHHAILEGLIDHEKVHPELGQVIIGEALGRSDPDEIIVFDATGTGLQDAAGAAAAYERAIERGVGTYFDFFAH